MNSENAQHETFVGDGIHIVELSLVTQGWIGWILIVGARKENRVFLAPLCAPYKIGALAIAPDSAPLV